MKKVWIFFPEMTLAQFPKSDFLNFRWIFFSKMTLAQFPAFRFFFQNTRIGVNRLNFWVFKIGFVKFLQAKLDRLLNNVSTPVAKIFLAKPNVSMNFVR